MKVIQFIRVNHLFNRVAFVSAAGLFLLAILLCLPISNNEIETKAITGTAAESTITLDVTNSTASVDLAVNSTSGNFAVSANDDKASFNVATNNYTGYTLSISADDDTGTLVNGEETLESITANLTEEQFNTAANNGKWGYSPSKYMNGGAVVDNTGNNSVFLSSPTTESTTLDVTGTANNEANTYTIGLGARADYSVANGAYTKTFTLIAVGNPINYSITYNANAGTDTVANMPYESTNNVQAGDTNSTSITLSDLVPVRDGYTFKGWCSATTSDDTCSGTIYNPDGDTTNLIYGIDQTVLNDATIFAMWKNEVATCTKQYRLQNADGTYPDEYTEDGSEELNLGETCTYAKTITDYQGDNGNDTERIISQILNEDTTLSMDFPRNTYVLTVEYDPTYISSVTGAGTYSWGEPVSISTVSSSGNEFIDWSQTSGIGQDTAENFDDITLASAVFTMPKSDATIFSNGDIKSLQHTAAEECTTSGITRRDNRDNERYLIRKLSDGKCWMQDNLNIDIASVSLDTLKGNTNATDTDLNYLKNGGGSGQYATSGVTSSWSNEYTIPVIDISNRNTTVNGYGSGSRKIGVYYNTCAATAGTFCYAQGSGSGTASSDICPSGWRLPTSSEFSTLYGKYSFANFISNFSVILSGRFTGSTSFLNERGYWWASNSSSHELQSLMSYTNRVVFETRTPSYGLSVRCVLK